MVNYNHHCWAAIVSCGWAKASVCRLQVSLLCDVLCHIVSLQYLSSTAWLVSFVAFSCRMFSNWCHIFITLDVRSLAVASRSRQSNWRLSNMQIYGKEFPCVQNSGDVSIIKLITIEQAYAVTTVQAQTRGQVALTSSVQHRKPE